METCKVDTDITYILKANVKKTLDDISSFASSYQTDKV